MKILTLALGTGLLALGACAAPPASNLPPNAAATPRSGTPAVSNAAGSASGMPQTSNSLPAGSRVNAPVASQTGVLETTRVR